ncbi:MAG TPA: nucleotide sugar dehydrogenase [Candidatus Limnocylindria bacterium]|nr:nucleotide sugar dehydrogenase [Candidatus Limnocylindria bacterium]
MNDSPSLNLAVVGSGYVGLVTAACLASMGHTVRVIERDPKRVAALNQGIVPFRETGLDEAVANGLARGRLSFFESPSASHGCAAALICVGTMGSDGEWSAVEVEAALRQFAADRAAPRTIIIRSSLLPGTTAGLDVLARGIDPQIEVALNPEFTRQGSAMRDFFTPDRNVVGLCRPAAQSGAAKLMADVFAVLDAPLLVTDAATAELIKMGSNTFLALKAGYANELARLAAATGADVNAVVDAIGMDRRIGRDFLSPGPGFGGSCLPSQARALPQLASTLGVDVPILSAISPSNVRHAQWVVDRLEAELGDLSGQWVCLLGLAFKAGTDDVRESSAIAIAKDLAQRGAQLTVHDPLALTAGMAALENGGVSVRRHSEVPGALDGAAAVVVATEWPLYKTIDWHGAASRMAGRLVLDLRGVVDRDAATGAGMRLIIHGRAASAMYSATRIA